MYLRTELLKRDAQFHTTVLRMKKAKAFDLEETFDEDDGDLFSSTPAAETPAPLKNDTITAVKPSESREDTSQAFEQLAGLMIPRLGRYPEIATPIRRGALIQLINLASNLEHLEKTSEVIKLYHDNERHKTILEETDAGDAFITRCITLNAPDLLLRVIQNRSKYGISLTQRRLHRTLFYLAHSKPKLSQNTSNSKETEESINTTPFDHFTAALSLLPIYQLSSTSTKDFSARADPVVTLCLLNLLLSLPIPREQFTDLQAAVTDITSGLGGNVTDGKEMKLRYPAVERNQLSSMLQELKLLLIKLRQNDVPIQLPAKLTESLDKLFASGVSVQP